MQEGNATLEQKAKLPLKTLGLQNENRRKQTWNVGLLHDNVPAGLEIIPSGARRGDATRL